jgi:hypothetical protein
VARVGRLAREIERRECGAEADVVADAGQQLGGGGAAARRPTQRVELVAEHVELRRRGAGQRVGLAT